MSNLTRICATITGLFQRAGAVTLEATALPNPGGLFNLAVRYNIRNHFPRPCERKRILRHGWNKRMSSAGGQRIILRRILKGKHVITH